MSYVRDCRASARKLALVVSQVTISGFPRRSSSHEAISVSRIERRKLFVLLTRLTESVSVLSLSTAQFFSKLGSLFTIMLKH